MQDGPVVTFGMGESLFALPVALVQEILDPRPVSRLPNSPRHLLGVMDVRGQSVAVVDLRALMGELPREDQSDTRIMVLQIDKGGPGGGTLHVALRVDRVIEVTRLDDGRLEPLAEAAFLDWNLREVEGIGRRNGSLVAVLRAEGLLDRDMVGDLAARPGEALGARLEQAIATSGAT